MDRYLRQLTRDLALLRLQRAAELEHQGKLQLQMMITGYQLDAPGAATLPEHEDEPFPANDHDEPLPLPVRFTAWPDDDEEEHDDQESSDEELDQDHLDYLAPQIEADIQSYLAESAPGEPDPALLSFAENIGLDIAIFPPAESLTERQAAHILAELLPLMSAFGRHSTGPDDYPRLLMYPIVLGYLRTPGQPRAGALMGYDGCSGDPVGCSWGKYCTCLAYHTKADFIADGGDPTDIENSRFADPNKPSGFDWRKA